MGLPFTKLSAWRRYNNTNEYAEQPEWVFYRNMNIDPQTFLQDNLSKFRNDIYNYALATSPYDNKNTKSIYLYADGIRLVKASLTKPMVLDIEFRSEHVANLYANTSEKLISSRYFSRQEQFEKTFKYNNYYLGGYYFWPFTRYVVDQNNNNSSVTI